MSEEDIIQEAIGYSFEGLDVFVLIEDLCNEFKLDYSKYWMRPKRKEDWYCTGDYVIAQKEPILLEEYDLTYDIPYDDKNISKVKFVEFLIDSYIEYIGYIEACCKQEIDNNEKDTE